MPDKRQALDRLREQLEEGERDISEADRELLIEFSDTLELIPSRIGVDRHEKLLRHCTILAERAGGLSDALKDREAAERAGVDKPVTFTNFGAIESPYCSRIP